MPKKQKGNPPPPLFLVSFSVILRLEKKKKRGTRLQWGMKGEPRSPPPYFDADAVSQQVCSAPPWKRGEKNPINGIPLGRRKKLFFACFASASAVIAVHKFAFRPLSIRGRSEFDGRGGMASWQGLSRFDRRLVRTHFRTSSRHIRSNNLPALAKTRKGGKRRGLCRRSSVAEP